MSRIFHLSSLMKTLDGNFSRCFKLNHADIWKLQHVRTLCCDGYRREFSMKRMLLANHTVDSLASISQFHTTRLSSNQPTKSSKKSTKIYPFMYTFYQKRDKFEDYMDDFFKRYSAKAFVDKAPESIRPYLQLNRLDKPIGTLLLYYPCVYSICLATSSGHLPSLYYLGLFGVGAILMRGSGCIINDLWDSNLDKLVDRTKDRPIASGKVSINNAIKLLAVELTLSLGILLSLNTTCIMIGFASMIPVVLYPLAKRYTSFPQAVLGLTFNMGAVMGYVAVTGSLDWMVTLPLYASCFCWTIYYDTVYAFQDVEDDKKAGIKSIARLFDKYSEEDLKDKPLPDRLDEMLSRNSSIKTFLSIAAISHILLMYAAGLPKYLDGPFTLSLIMASAKIVEQMIILEPESRKSCWEVFVGNRWIGVIFALGIITAIWLQPKQDKKRLIPQ